MGKTTRSLLLAFAIIATAVLAAFDFMLEEAAQFAPFLLLALFPDAWLRGERSCNLLTGAG